MADQEVSAAAVADIDLGDLFKDFVWGAVIKVATEQLILLIPFLGLGPLGPITGVIVGIVLDLAYDALSKIINPKLIAFKNVQIQRAYDDAAVKLRIVGRDKGIDSPEFRAERVKHRAALFEAVRPAISRP